MVVKYFATILITLVVLPTTAPFSTLESRHFASGYQRILDAGPIRVSIPNASDDDDAIVPDRATFVSQSQARALTPVPNFRTTALTSAPEFTHATVTQAPVDSGHITTVLRV